MTRSNGSPPGGDGGDHGGPPRSVPPPDAVTAIPPAPARDDGRRPPAPGRVPGPPGGELPCRTFAEAVRRWRPFIYRLALCRSGGDEALAEDVCQEVTFNLYRKEGGGPPPHPLAPLIGRLYMGAIRNALRSRRRQRIAGEPESERMPSSQTPERQLRDAEDDLELQQDAEAVFREMDPEDVELIQLSRDEGLSYQEIADFIGCPLGTVKSRLSRARHTLLEGLRRRKLIRR